MVMNMKSERIEKAKPILEILESHQHEAYFVGGCVRDLLLNRPIKDVDIATSAKPDEVQSIFEKVIPVGIEHGTVLVRYKNESYEVTTFRIDGEYSDSRHPDAVEFIDKIDRDLERRDFTINALAMDARNHVIDLFDGKSDLADGLIRTVGNGYERFKEDALRIIRALRFSSQLGFSIEQETLQHMIACKADIQHISVERITNEMDKFFAGEFIEQGLKYFFETEIYNELPILKDHQDLIHQLPQSLKPLPSFAAVITLFHFLDKEISITDWIKAWKCSNSTKRSAIELYDYLMYYRKNGLSTNLIYRLQEQHYTSFIRLIDILFNDKVRHEDIMSGKKKLPIQSRKELAINGNDLLRLFPKRASGAWIKEMLDDCEEQVINGKIQNDNNVIKEWLLWHQQEID